MVYGDSPAVEQVALVGVTCGLVKGASGVEGVKLGSLGLCKS